MSSGCAALRRLALQVRWSPFGDTLLRTVGSVLQSPSMSRSRVVRVAAGLVLTVAAVAYVVARPSADPPAALSVYQGDEVAGWLGAISQARLQAGLAPYAYNLQLSAAAQRHADDVAANGFVYEDVHRGSDGSTSKERIEAAGYEPWTWSSGISITGENVWMGFGGVDDAMTWFMNSPPHHVRTCPTIVTNTLTGTIPSTCSTRAFLTPDTGRCETSDAK